MIKVQIFNELSQAWENYCHDYAQYADYYTDQGMLVSYL